MLGSVMADEYVIVQQLGSPQSAVPIKSRWIAALPRRQRFCDGPTPSPRARHIFSQVVMAFLVGVGDEEPLRYRILPINKFMNLGARRL